MSGITQMVLTQSEPVVGNRGKVSNYNSLIFGQDAFYSTIQYGDNAKMSSLTMSNIPAVGTGAFSIEYWIKYKNLAFNNIYVHENGQVVFGSGSVTGGLALLHKSNELQVNNYLVTNNTFSIPTQAIPSQTWELDVWYHVAVSRNVAGQLTVFVNGYRSPDGSESNLINYNLVPTIVGSWRNTKGFGTTNNFIGQMFGLRMLIGTTAYNPTLSQVNFPRFAPVTTVDTKLLMLAPTSSIYSDVSGTGSVIPRAGAVASTRSSPYHDQPTLVDSRYNASSPFTVAQSGSLRLKGKASSYATYSGNSGLAFGTGDFTIEFFAFQSDVNLNSTVFWFGTTGTPVFGLSFEKSGTDTNITWHTAAGASILQTVATTTFFGQWKHWAIVRISGVIYLYFNGTLLNVGGFANVTNYATTSGTFYIGKRGQSGTDAQAFGGYITNLRIVKGVGVYSGTFTVPTGNVQRVDFANPYGGSNTSGVRSDQVTYLMVP